MRFKRISRGIRAILNLARPDDAWARRFLTESEARLFMTMDPRDREHGVAVARALLARFPHAPQKAIRAALLHDVGKTLRPYIAFERIILGLFDPILPHLPSRPLKKGLAGAVQLRRHHEVYGAEMVEDPEVAAMILGRGAWGERIRAIDDRF